MAEKITKAVNDKTARDNAVTALGLDALAKVSNTEYALYVKNAEGTDVKVVIKLTVTKSEATIDEMVEAYAEKSAETEAKKVAKEAERAAKKAEKVVKAPKAKATKETDVTENLEF